MPFIIPCELTKISTSSRFSKYKIIDETDLFIFQKRKRTFRRENTPTYRIITQNRPFFEVAQGYDLDELRQNEWAYMRHRLPKIMPKNLNPKARQSWFIAHFTQIALEHGAEASGIATVTFNFKRDDDDASDEELGTTLRTLGGEPLGEPEDKRPEIPSTRKSSVPQIDSDLLYNPPKINSPIRSPPSPQVEDRTLLHIEQLQKGIMASLSQRVSSLEARVPLSSTSLSSLTSQDQIAMLNGKSSALMLVLLISSQWLLVRDSSFPVFAVFLVTFNLFIFFLALRGDPVRIGLVIRRMHQRSSSSTKSTKVSSIISSITRPTRKIKPQSHFKETQGSHVVPLESEINPTRALSDSKRLAKMDSSDSENEIDSKRNTTDEKREIEKLSSAKQSSKDNDTEEIQDQTTSSSSIPANDNTKGDLPDAGLPSVKVPCGTTVPMEQMATIKPHSWCRVDATSFKVRVGPQYLKNKRKENSKQSLYVAVSADIFQTPVKLSHAMRYLILPDPPSADDMGEADLSPEEKKALGNENKLAQYFVANFQFPSYAPSNPFYGKPKEDGVGFSLVLVYYMLPSTRRALLGPDDHMSPALRLLKRFIEADQVLDSDANWLLRKRLKCIPRLVNADELNLGRMMRGTIATYNEKPFMTGPRCHSFYRGPNYVEVDVDYHKFCYLARQGAWQFLDTLKDFTFDLALVVQAEDDEEMPEQVFAVARVCKLQQSSTLEEARASLVKKGIPLTITPTPNSPPVTPGGPSPPGR